MKKLIVIIILIMGFSISSFAADDPSGWKTAKWGMNLKELLNAIPDAHEDSSVVFREFTTIAAIDDVVISGTHFKVSFLTDRKDGKLTRVYMEPIDDGNKATGTVAYSLIIQKLTEKYGAPANAGKDNAPLDSRLKSTFWYFTTTTIEVSLLTLDPPYGSLGISYTQKRPEQNL